MLNQLKYQTDLPTLLLPKMSEIRNECQLGSQTMTKKDPNNEEKS